METSGKNQDNSPLVTNPVHVNFRTPPPRPISALDDLINIREDWQELLDETKKLRSKNTSSSTHKSAHSSCVSSSNPNTKRPLKYAFPKSATKIIEHVEPKKGLLANDLPWQTNWWMQFHPLPIHLVSSNMSWNYSGHRLTSALQSDSKDSKPFLANKNKKTRTSKRTLEIISKNVLEGELLEAFQNESISERIEIENAQKKRAIEESRIDKKGGTGSLISDRNTSTGSLLSKISRMKGLPSLTGTGINYKTSQAQSGINRKPF